MPFTPAHPAFVLPFLKIKKEYVSATGLVVGSIIPDFEYFFNMSVKGQHSHTLAGLFYFDIPLGIIITILFHEVVKKNFIDNLPAFFQRRLNPLRELEFMPYVKQNLLAWLSAIALGAASHLLWDSFTHRDGFFVNHLSFYDSVFPFDGVQYPMYYALQHISTFTGLFAIGFYFIFMKQDPTIKVTRPHFGYWSAVLLITAVILFARFSLGRATLDFGNFVVSSITSACCSFLVAGKIRFSQTTS